MATRAQCAAQNEAIQAGEELVYDVEVPTGNLVWVAAGQDKNGHAGYYLSRETLFRSNLISVSNKQVDFFLRCVTH